MSNLEEAKTADAKILHAQKGFDLEGVTFLNCATQGPFPAEAVQALEEALELKKNPFLIRDSDYFDVPNAYRREAAGLLGCSPEDIAVTDSATHGMMILVNGLDWRAGDEVVIPRGEFPANRFPWLSLESKGVKVHEVGMPAGPAGLEALESAMNERTRLVAASWVRYSSGLRIDLDAVGALCRRRGALLAIDGSQGVGGFSLDLRQTPCDLLTCAGYKWLLGPYGTGLAYVAPELADRLGVGNINWFAIRGARNFNRLSHCRLDFEPGARRFDVNETANFLNLLPATASLKLLRRLTVPAIEAYVQELLEYFAESLPSGYHPASDRTPIHRSHLFYFAAGDEAATAAAYQRLVDKKIVVAQREGAIRVSPFIYNTREDIDRLLEALREG